VLAVLARALLRAQPRRVAALLLPLALSALGYLAWTRLAFGTWGPVSALVKTQVGGEAWTVQSAWQRLTLLLYLPLGVEPHVRRLLQAAGLTPAAAPLIGTLVPLALLAVLVWQRRRLVPRAPGTGAVFVMATAAAMMLTDKLGVLAGRVRSTRIATAVLAIVCVARVVQPFASLRFGPPAPLGLVAAQWLRPHLQAGAVAASWNAGLIGYFAGGRVVNLDGLVNDAAFLRDVVRGGDLDGYLERERVRFLVDATTPEARLAPLVRRYPAAVAAAVEARYRQVAEFGGHCGDVSACPRMVVWERTGR
jgi:hypothetical protein